MFTLEQILHIEDSIILVDGSVKGGHEFCYDGVFMEFTRSAPPSFYSKEDPFFPCNLLEKEFGEIYSASCGRNQPSVFAGRLGLDFPKSASLCGQNSLSDNFKSSCFDALGFSLASSGDADKIIVGCKSIPNPNHLALCLKAAAGELVFQETPGWQEKSTKICKSSPHQQSCQENVNRLVSDYGR